MNLCKNIQKIHQSIIDAAQSCNRNPGNILLLAVSKQQSIEAIQEAYRLGITQFGESYFQEALQKIKSLEKLPISWHFIGPIQSNKTKGIATYFSWVHSISRLKIAQLLNTYRPKNLEPLNVCLQISLIEEKNKSGISPEQATELALAINQLPHLKLRGLMTIPPVQENPQKQYEVFLQLNQLMHSLNQELRLNMDTLSMGMSDDIVPAIKAGSTLVRIGRAIFGDRHRNEL